MAGRSAANLQGVEGLVAYAMKQKKKVLLNYRFLVAVDFGTTYTGFAFQVQGSDDVTVHTQWGGQNQDQYKTASCILFNADRSFSRFGEDAQKEFIEMDPAEAKTMFYFEKFKMLLLTKVNEEPLTRNVMLVGAHNKQMPAVDVIGGALRFMKDTFKQVLHRSKSYVPRDDEIMWVVTVPAIWDDAARQFMREAAVKGGLIPSAKSQRLQLALEPEAAGVLCTTLPVAQFVEESAESRLEVLQPGDSYMVVDCGGGTIDIAVHELLDSGGIRQKHSACGGAWGGDNVNSAFLSLLKDIYSPHIIDQFKGDDPQDWFEFCGKFETVKRSFKHSAEKPLRIELPQELCQRIRDIDAQQNGIEPHESRAVQELAERHKQRTGDDVEYKRSHLYINFKLAKKLFDVSISPLVDQLKKMARKPLMAGVSRVFVVGGFGDCSYLQTRVKESLPRRIKCLVPVDAGKAVMKGAVLFGRNPQIVEERIAGLTYGFKIVEKWQERKHGRRPDLKISFNGQMHCRDVLEPFLHENDPVKLGERPHVQLVKAMDKESDQIFVELFSREGYEEVMFTDERCKGVGRIHKMLKPLTAEQAESAQHLQGREFALGFIFTETEIRVLAVDVLTGDCEYMDIDFLQKAE